MFPLFTWLVVFLHLEMARLVQSLICCDPFSASGLGMISTLFSEALRKFELVEMHVVHMLQPYEARNI